MKTIKYKNKYFSYLQKQSYKIAVVLVVISMFVNFSNINPTYAYFSDEATITGNTFTAGTLAFLLNPSADITSTLSKGDSSSPLSTTIANDGSLGFQYTIGTTNTTGDADLCNYLTLNASLNGSSIYNSSLSSFSTTAQNYSNPSDWNFVVTLPSGATDSLQDKTCNFKFTFSGWQESLSSTEGFSDTKQINGTITSGHWAVVPPTTINPGDVVINEVMWMGSSTSSADEWLELRNMTGHDIILSNWKLENSAESHGTLTLSGTLPANGYFVISNYDKTNSAINVTVDINTTSMSFINTYDDNGKINLKDSNNNLIDSTPTPPTNHKWPAGDDSGRSWSMERNLTPGIGTLDSSWHTCDADHMNSTDTATMENYWDLVEKGKGNCGTPGYVNLSANDPTSPDYNPSLFSDEVSVEPVKSVESEEIPKVITEIPPATEPEKIVVEETEAVDTPVGEVLEPEDTLEIIEPADAESSGEAMEEPVITPPEAMETEPVVVEDPTVIE